MDLEQERPEVAHPARGTTPCQHTTAGCNEANGDAGRIRHVVPQQTSFKNILSALLPSDQRLFSLRS